MKHLFDSSDFNVYTKEYCNFSVGAPGPDLLEKCCDIFKEATVARMEYEKTQNQSYLFQYGPTQGLEEFRKALAGFLSRNYGGAPVASENLLLTTGASNGLHLIASLLVDPNALIIVDHVTYMIALETLRDFPGFNIIPCPLEEDGPNLMAMEEILLKNSRNVDKVSGQRFHTMYYTIPVHHNPTGITFSADKRKALVELSRKFNFLVACDDVYNMLGFSGFESVSRLISMDDEEDGNKGTIISNGTFSKIFSPGIRVGWIEAPKWMIRILSSSGVLKSGGALTNYMSGIITEIIQNGKMDEILNLYQKEYQERMQLACTILAQDLNPMVKYHQPKGGFFIWLEFPQGFDASEFNLKLRDSYKVFGCEGKRFSVTNGSQNCLRLCVVFHQVDVIERGMRQLCRAVADHFQS